MIIFLSSLCLVVLRIPLIDDLVDDQIPRGSNILVEFDHTISPIGRVTLEYS